MSYGDTNFNDIIGNDEAKIYLKELLNDSFKERELYVKMNIRPLLGVVLYGYPGVGKSALAHACINEFFKTLDQGKLDIFEGNASRFMMANGRTNKLSDFFESLRNDNKIHILIINEIETLLIGRDYGWLTTKERADVLLDEFSESKDNANIIVIGTTNRPWEIDNAYFRPGRFKLVKVDLPNYNERLQLLHKYSYRKEYKLNGTKFEIIAKNSEGCTGAEIEDFGRSIFNYWKPHRNEDNFKVDDKILVELFEKSRTYLRETKEKMEKFMKEIRNIKD